MSAYEITCNGDMWLPFSACSKMSNSFIAIQCCIRYIQGVREVCGFHPSSVTFAACLLNLSTVTIYTSVHPSFYMSEHETVINYNILMLSDQE